MASVVLPEPPFWVANTIVCIEKSFGLRWSGYAVRHTLGASHLRVAGQFLPRTCRPDPKGSRKSESVHFMMPDNGNVAIPYDYWRFWPKASSMPATGVGSADEHQLAG